MWMNVKGHTQQFRGLVDTGAQVNLIAPRLLQHFPHKFLFRNDMRVMGVEGHDTLLRDWYMVQLQFPNGQNIEIPMIQGTDNGVGFILGMPFLLRVDAVINVRLGIVETSKGCFGWTPASPLPSRVLMNVLQSLDSQMQTVSEEDEALLQKAMKNNNLSAKGQEKLRQLFRKYYHVWNGSKPGKSAGFFHEFILTDPRPVRLNPRPIPQRWHLEIEKQEKIMLEDDIIEASTSPYRTYPVLVAKKDGTVRFAIDFRKLNLITLPDKKPLPRIEDLIAQVRDAEYFCLLDLRSGFWQIPIRPDQRHLTAFSTHHGHWHFKRMPFGVVNGPATFQRWIETMVGDLYHQGVSAYIDDILIHAKTEDQLLERIELVLQRLSSGGAKLKITKCELAPTQFEYLGHTFGGGRRYPQPKKLLKLGALEPPKNISEVRTILGMLSYYRLYIPHFADLVKPLTSLTKKGNNFEWTSHHQQAVDKAIEILKEASLQQAPFSNSFRLETDASDTALGAVLYDKESYDKSEGKCPPLMFMSRTLTHPETNWTANEREAYAVIWALDACQQHVKGREVHVYTDHKNLPGMLNNSQNAKIVRWAIRLAEYNPAVHHIKGKDNIVADFLSRQIAEEDDPDYMYCWPIVNKRNASTPENEEDLTSRKRLRTVMPPSYEEETKPLDTTDPTYNPELDFTTELMNLPTVFGHEDDQIRVPRLHFMHDINLPTVDELLEAQKREKPDLTERGFLVEGECIGYLHGIWLPPSLRDRVLDWAHLSTPYIHSGVEKMMTNICKTYNWKGMRNDIRNYVGSCLVCQRLKPRFNPQEVIVRHHPMLGPFKALYMDIWGPLNQHGKDYYFLTMADHFTKWIEVAIIPDTTSSTIAKALITQWVSRFGAPDILVTDNATSFVSSLMSHVCNLLGTRKLRTTVYHPQGNAPAERFHQHLRKMFKYSQMVSPLHFDVEETLAIALLTYRAQPHDSTNSSPSYMTHGVDITLQHQHPQQATTTENIFQDLRSDLLLKFRQDLIEQYQRKLKQTETTEPTGRIFQRGDIIILQLTDAQIRKYAKIVNSSTKVITEWSLPMRVLYVNSTHTTATVRCMATGWTTSTHLNRVKFLQKPATPAMQQDWLENVKSETPIFSMLTGRSNRNQLTDDEAPTSSQ